MSFEILVPIRELIKCWFTWASFVNVELKLNVTPFISNPNCVIIFCLAFSNYHQNDNATNNMEIFWITVERLVATTVREIIHYRWICVSTLLSRFPYLERFKAHMSSFSVWFRYSERLWNSKQASPFIEKCVCNKFKSSCIKNQVIIFEMTSRVLTKPIPSQCFTTMIHCYMALDPVSLPVVIWLSPPAATANSI